MSDFPKKMVRHEGKLQDARTVPPKKKKKKRERVGDSVIKVFQELSPYSNYPRPKK